MAFFENLTHFYGGIQPPTRKMLWGAIVALFIIVCSWTKSLFTPVQKQLVQQPTQIQPVQDIGILDAMLWCFNRASLNPEDTVGLTCTFQILIAAAVLLGFVKLLDYIASKGGGRV